MGIFPNCRGENKKYLSCHQPLIVCWNWKGQQTCPKATLPKTNRHSRAPENDAFQVPNLQTSTGLPFSGESCSFQRGYQTTKWPNFIPKRWVGHFSSLSKGSRELTIPKKVTAWITTWRIIPVSKWLVTPIYKPFSPFGRGITLLRGLTNRGY